MCHHGLNGLFGGRALIKCTHRAMRPVPATAAARSCLNGRSLYSMSLDVAIVQATGGTVAQGKSRPSARARFDPDPRGGPRPRRVLVRGVSEHPHPTDRRQRRLDAAVAAARQAVEAVLLGDQGDAAPHNDAVRAHQPTLQKRGRTAACAYAGATSGWSTGMAGKLHGRIHRDGECPAIVVGRRVCGDRGAG